MLLLTGYTTNMKKYFLAFISFTLLLLIICVGVYGIGKYVLPDILGTTDVENTIQKPIPGESILYKKAPEFNIPSIEGRQTSLSDFFGIPTVIVFWSTWNRGSADQISILDEYITQEKVQSSLINILAINSQEDQSIVKSFIRRGGYTIPVLLDTAGDISQMYNIKDFPTMYFISRNGAVKEIHTGTLNRSIFVEKVDSLLKQNGVE